VIRIVNKHTHKPTRFDVYIGRGSPFGNPYSWKEGTKAEFIVGSREEAIAAYRPWFNKRRLNDPVMAMMLNQMCCAYLDGHDINLVCYCTPEPCHGSIIKDYLEAFKAYAESRYKN
jgi:hypothetical protein